MQGRQILDGDDFAQSIESSACAALHRSDTDSKGRSGLRLGEIVEVSEHEHRALPPGELVERPDERVSHDDVRGEVRVDPFRWVDEDLGRPCASTSPSVGGQICDRRPRVRLWDAGDAGPAPGGALERGLQQVFGRMQVAHKQVRRAQQPVTARFDKRLEVGLVLALHGGTLADLVTSVITQPDGEQLRLGRGLLIAAAHRAGDWIVAASASSADWVIR